MNAAENFATALWAMVTGLTWLWTFLAYLAAASVAVSTSTGALILIHQLREKQLQRQEVRRG